MSVTVNARNETHTFPAQLTVIHCKCGGIYAIHERYRQEKEINCGSWSCPYCMTGWGYCGETALAKEQRLRKNAEDRLARERAEFDQTKARLADEIAHKESQRRAEKAAKTKLKKRVANGVCPCCKRHFANLHAHMTNQHPEFAVEETGA